MLCILRLGNQVGSYFGPNFGCYGSLLAKIGVPILPKLVPVCQVGCPTSRSNYNPSRIQTISDYHISNPSGGHLWPKLVHFGPPRTTNGGALFPIFLRTIDIQCWTRFCKKLAIFGNFFVIFGPSCHLKLCLLINMFCDCDFHQLLQINDTLLCQKCLFFV